MIQTLSAEPVLGTNAPLIPISNSEIGTYKDCKRKWWLSYYLGFGPREEKQTGALAFGTRIHAALEEMYKRGVDPAQAFLDEIKTTEIQMLSKGQNVDDLKKDAELGRIMLEGYVEWLEETGADFDIEITDSEKKLSAQILNGRVEVRGKVDLRVVRKTDGARRVLDFKSVANRDTYVKIAHMAEQLKLYILLETMNETDGKRIDGGIYRLLKKVKRSASAKPPFYEDYEVRHGKHTMESFWLSLHGVVQDIVNLRDQLDAGADPKQVAYPTPSNDCTWKCPFYQACPMFDNGSAVDDYVHDNYKQYDPYLRYEDLDD